MQQNIETPIPTGKSVTPKESNTKTILKLEPTIYALVDWIMDNNDWRKDLVNTLFNIQQKASSQNLNKKLNTVTVNKINSHHHKLNKVHKSTFTPAISKQSTASHAKQDRPITTSRPNILKSHQPQPQHQTQPQQTSLYIGNLDQKVNEEHLYELYGLKSTECLRENYLY